MLVSVPIVDVVKLAWKLHWCLFQVMVECHYLDDTPVQFFCLWHQQQRQRSSSNSSRCPGCCSSMGAGSSGAVAAGVGV